MLPPKYQESAVRQGSAPRSWPSDEDRKVWFSVGEEFVVAKANTHACGEAKEHKQCWCGRQYPAYSSGEVGASRAYWRSMQRIGEALVTPTIMTVSKHCGNDKCASCCFVCSVTDSF